MKKLILLSVLIICGCSSYTSNWMYGDSEQCEIPFDRVQANVSHQQIGATGYVSSDDIKMDDFFHAWLENNADVHPVKPEVSEYSSAKYIYIIRRQDGYFDIQILIDDDTKYDYPLSGINIDDYSPVKNIYIVEQFIPFEDLTNDP